MPASERRAIHIEFKENPRISSHSEGEGSNRHIVLEYTSGNSISTDTIAALSTPYGVGGVAVIRCSGELALNILKSLSNRDTLEPRKLYHGLLKHPETEDIIDDACVVFLKAPIPIQAKTV